MKSLKSVSLRPSLCRSIVLCKPRLCHYTDSSEAICRLQVESTWNGLYWGAGKTYSSWEDNVRLAFHSAWADSAGMKVMPCFKHPPPQAACLRIQLKVRPDSFLSGRIRPWPEVSHIDFEIHTAISKMASHISSAPLLHSRPWISLLALRWLHLSGTKSFKVSSPELSVVSFAVWILSF